MIVVVCVVAKTETCDDTVYREDDGKEEGCETTELQSTHVLSVNGKPRPSDVMHMRLGMTQPGSDPNAIHHSELPDKNL